MGLRAIAVLSPSLALTEDGTAEVLFDSCAKPAHSSFEEQLFLRILSLLYVHNSSIGAFVADLPQTYMILDQR